jgi:cation:H+ antiporter
VSEFVAAFILMATATTLPELFVGISSALNNNTALALGTVLGSNIANLTLIIGLPILLVKGIKIKREGIKKDALYMLLIMAFPLVLMWIGRSISRIDGILLIGVFVLHSWRMLRNRKKFRKKVKNNIGRKEIVLTVFLFIVCVAVLFLSSKFVVKYATMLSIDLFLPPIMIGLFLVAIGTSLPELVFGTGAALKGHSEMSVGNVLGANIANSSLILGVVALITPITGQFLLFFISAIFMMMAGFLFVTFIESEKKLDWMEGVSLLLLYVFFIVVQFFIRFAIKI